MAELKQYKNETHSKDWALYFDKQETEHLMRSIAAAADLQFLIWTRARRDGFTIAWAQTRSTKSRDRIVGWFRNAKWIGTTGGHEEYISWFKEGEVEPFRYAGHYAVRERTDMVAGHTMICEIIDATAVMDMCLATEDDTDSDEEPGKLVRTYAKYF